MNYLKSEPMKTQVGGRVVQSIIVSDKVTENTGALSFRKLNALICEHKNNYKHATVGISSTKLVIQACTVYNAFDLHLHLFRFCTQISKTIYRKVLCSTTLSDDILWNMITVAQNILIKIFRHDRSEYI